MRILSSHSGNPRRRAAAVAEFAFIAPVIAILVVGMFEMGHAFMVKQVLSDAAQKACRTGSQPGKGNVDILSDVNAVLTANNITYNASYVTVSVISQSGTNQNVDASAASAGDQICVKVSIPVSKVSWTTFYLSSGNVESETVVMMKQGSTPYSPYTP